MSWHVEEQNNESHDQKVFDTSAIELTSKKQS